MVKHIYIHTPSHTHSFTNTLPRTHSQTHTLTNTLIHKHTPLHTHSFTHTHTFTPTPPQLYAEIAHACTRGSWTCFETRGLPDWTPAGGYSTPSQMVGEREVKKS